MLEAEFNRLREFISGKLEGKCKVISQGYDGCTCPLCDLGRVRDAVLTPRSEANTVQYGGTHYRQYGDIQPWDVWMRWGLDPFQATILRYIVRWKDKNGTEDLAKARHYLEKYMEEIAAGRVSLKKGT